MSSRRSSSGDAFLNIRAKFEKVDGTDARNLSPNRGISPSNNGSRSRSPPRNQRIRASFIAVEPSGQSGIAMASEHTHILEQNKTASQRRPSFSLSQERDREAIAELKKTVSNEAERRKSIPELEHNVVPESAILSNMPTPIPEATEPISPPDMAAAAQSVAAGGMAGGDKSVASTGNETRKAQLEKPKSLAAQTNGDSAATVALDGQTGQGQKETSATNKRTNGIAGTSKAPKVGTSSTTRPASSRPSLAQQSVTSVKPASSAAPTAAPKKTSRPSTYMNPTTSSATVATSSKVSNIHTQKASPPRKNKPRSPTRPIELPSHLTAPTVSSAAKHEPEPTTGKRVSSGSRPLEVSSHLMAPTASSKAKHDTGPMTAAPSKASVPNRPPAPVRRDRTSTSSNASAVPARKPAVRPSLAAGSGGVQAQQTEGRSPTTTTPAPGFLERMAKPTAASSNRGHEKTKSPESKAGLKQSTVEKKPMPAPKPSTSRQIDTTAKPASKSATAETAAKPSTSRQADTAAKPASKPATAEKASKPSTSRQADTAAKPASTSATTETASKPQATKIGPASESRNSAAISSATTGIESHLVPNKLPPPQKENQRINAATGDDKMDKEWNAAALPGTPQREREDEPVAGLGMSKAVTSNEPSNSKGDVLNPSPLTPEPKPTSTAPNEAGKLIPSRAAEKAAARRSMMDTPELAESTIR